MEEAKEGHPATQGDAVPVSLECGPLAGKGRNLWKSCLVDCTQHSVLLKKLPLSLVSLQYFRSRPGTGLCCRTCAPLFSEDALAVISLPQLFPGCSQAAVGEDGPEVLAS